jgi:hypothetical protein
MTLLAPGHRSIQSGGPGQLTSARPLVRRAPSHLVLAGRSPVRARAAAQRTRGVGRSPTETG